MDIDPVYPTNNSIRVGHRYISKLTINPKFEDALYNKALDLDNLGNHTEALTYLDKVLAIDPKDKDALYHKGVVLDKLGNHTGLNDRIQQKICKCYSD